MGYARNVSTEGVFDVVLADNLTSTRGRDGTVNNGLWCAWGPAPNAAWLVAPNRTVLLAQSWFDAVEINATLRSLWR